MAYKLTSIRLPDSMFRAMVDMSIAYSRMLDADNIYQGISTMGVFALQKEIPQGLTADEEVEWFATELALYKLNAEAARTHFMICAGILAQTYQHIEGSVDLDQLSST